jgi:TRAP-type C4-dicarboxylate transport system permease small subunit
VVLRYGFGSGVAASEELSRLLFVWMVFIGATAAYPAGEHMAFTSLVGMLRQKPLAHGADRHGCDPPAGGDGLRLLAWGAWQQVVVGLDSHSVVLGYPVALLPLPACLCAMAIGLMALIELVSVARRWTSATARKWSDRDASRSQAFVVFSMGMLVLMGIGMNMALALVLTGCWHGLGAGLLGHPAAGSEPGGRRRQLPAAGRAVLHPGRRADERRRHQPAHHRHGAGLGGPHPRRAGLRGHRRGGADGQHERLCAGGHRRAGHHPAADDAPAGLPDGHLGGLVASGGIIAPIIPPSMPFVIYGVTTNTSISALFVSGIVPGLIMGTGLIVAWKWVLRKIELPEGEPLPMRERLKATGKAFWALLMPVIIIGGMKSPACSRPPRRRWWRPSMRWWWRCSCTAR